MVNLDYMELTIDFFTTIQDNFNQAACNTIFSPKRSASIWKYYKQFYNNEIRLYNCLEPAERQTLLNWYNQQVSDNKITIDDIEAALPFFEYISKRITKLCKKVWPKNDSHYKNLWTTKYKERPWDFYQNCDPVEKSQIDMFYRTNKIKTSVTINKF